MTRPRIELADLPSVDAEIIRRSFAFNRRPGPRSNRGRIPDGVGSGFPLSFFDLGAWDFSQVSGIDDDALSTGIASLAGSGANTMTPTGSPRLDDAAIGGRRAVSFDSAVPSYFICNALASRFTIGNGVTVVCRFRATSAADNPLFAAGKSTSAVDTFLRVFQTTGSVVRIDTNTTTTGTVQRTGTASLQYDENVGILTISAAGAIKFYIDGVLDTLTSSTMDPVAMACDRFAVAAVLSTAASAGMAGYVQWFGVSTSVATQAQVTQITAQLYSSDFILPKASSRQVCWVGDSITESSVGCLRVAGIRVFELQNIVDCGISLNHVGNRTQGTVPDRENVAQGGAAIATIAGNFTTAMSGDATMAPDLIIVMMGTNNISTAPAMATALSDYRAALAAIYSAAVARKPGVRIAVSTITPIQPGTAPADTNWPIFNTGLTTATTGEWDFFEALHPGVLIRCDNAAALGNAWSAGDFGADTTHPNESGVQKIGRAQMLVYGSVLRTFGATLKSLSCVIKAPAAASSLTYGSPVTVSGRVSRYPSTVVVKKGSTTLGSATMTDRAWSYSWTPLVGDLGAQTINAVVTDTIDSTTASATGVGVTIISAATPATIFGADLLQWCRADLGITVATGVSAWADQSGLVNDYAQGSGAAQPAYTATDATLSNLPTMTFNGSSQFLSATAFNLPAPGTTPTYVWIVVKQIAWVNGGRIVDGINGGAATTHVVYQNGLTPRIEQYDTSSVNGNTGLAVGTWGALGAGFNNATTDFIQVNDVAKVTGANAGNVASTGRRLGVSFSGFTNFANIAVAEIVYAKRMPTAGDLTAMSGYRTTRYGF